MFAAPDLDAGIEYVHELTGLRAEYGGIHPGFGTHNALLSLGARSYLEIIAPDPGQDSAIWLGIGDLESPRIVTWAACCNDLPRYAGLEFPGGQRPGGPHQGQAGTGRRAHVELRRGTRQPHHLVDVVDQLLVDPYVAGRLGDLQDLLRRGDRIDDACAAQPVVRP